MFLRIKSSFKIEKDVADAAKSGIDKAADGIADAREYSFDLKRGCSAKWKTEQFASYKSFGGPSVVSWPVMAFGALM